MRDREKKAGDPKRPEAKWLQLMYKIKKSFPFVLVCGTLCGPVRWHLCFVLSPGIVPPPRFFAILHSLHFLNRTSRFSCSGKSMTTSYFTTNTYGSSESSKRTQFRENFSIYSLINYRPYLLTAQS